MLTANFKESSFFGVDMNSKIVETGTTTVGIVAKDAVILAADSKASMAHLAYDEEAKKVFKITDRIGISIAGSVGDAQRLIRFLKSHAKLYELEHESKMTPSAAANLISNILNANRFFPYLVQFILGGVNKEPILYDLDPAGGMLERKKYAVTGSGTELALSVLDQNFKPNLSKDEALKLAVKAIKEAKRRDNFTGGFYINALIITKEGIEELTIKDLEKY